MVRQNGSPGQISPSTSSNSSRSREVPFTTSRSTVWKTTKFQEPECSGRLRRALRSAQRRTECHARTIRQSLQHYPCLACIGISPINSRVAMTSYSQNTMRFQSGDDILLQAATAFQSGDEPVQLGHICNPQCKVTDGQSIKDNTWFIGVSSGFSRRTLPRRSQSSVLNSGRASITNSRQLDDEFNCMDCKTS